jgi:ribose transport system substrate-binding protein
MERRSFVKMLGAAGVAAVAAPAVIRKAQAQDKPVIALIPGLTADGFYVTMHKGAQAAAAAVGAELIYQGSAEWNVSLQVPILEAVIAKGPKAIMIAPNDKTQMIEPLRKAHDAGIAVVCVDTFIGNGVFQTGSGDADFPISYVASDNVLGGRMAARALAKAIGEKGKVYVSNVKPGISTTDQREEGFKLEMANYKDVEILETQFNDDDANESIVAQLKDGTFELTIAQHPAEIGYFGYMAAYAHVTGNPVPTAIGTGFTVMTAANIDDPNVSKYLYKSE